MYPFDQAFHGELYLFHDVKLCSLSQFLQIAEAQDRWQSKMLILSMNGDHKGQLKTLFLAIFDPRSSIVKNVFECRLSSVGGNICYCQDRTKLLRFR